MALAGCVVGFAFLTKMLQAFLVVPGLALAFLVAAPIGVWKRSGRAARRRRRDGRVGRLVHRAGQPVARRLAALHRRLHRQQPAATGVGLQRDRAHRRQRAAAARWRSWPRRLRRRRATCSSAAQPGIGRLFGPSMGAEASWLLPAALIGLVAGLWLTRRAARTDRVRAGLLLWGGWLLVTGAVFSFMDGTVHPYYTVALAPAVAALVGHLGAPSCAAAGVAGGRGWCSRRCWRPPGCGRSSCWTARPTGCPRCAGSCWSVGGRGGWCSPLRAHRSARPRSRSWLRRRSSASAAPAAYSIYNARPRTTGPSTMSGPQKPGGLVSGGGGPGGPGRPGGPGGRTADSAAAGGVAQGTRQPLGRSDYRLDVGRATWS